MPPSTQPPVLQIEDLRVRFQTEAGVLDTVNTYDNEPKGETPLRVKEKHFSLIELQVVIAVIATLCSGTAKAADDIKPNVVFIFADDQDYQAVRALGNEEVITPNLDRLVRRGTTFTHAYNMGSWSPAVCVPARTMLMTGLTVWNARQAQQDGLNEGFVEKRRFWPQLLEQAGYETYMTGKWHVSADAQTAFNHVTNVRPGMPNVHPRNVPEGYDRPVEGEEDPWSPWDTTFGGFWQGGTHWSEVLAEDAEGFLEQAGTRDAPFFMYLAFNAPHDPRQSPKEYVDKYPLEEIITPKNFKAEYPYNDEIGSGRRLRDERLAPFPRTEYAVQVHRQEYYAIITHMDAQIGRILDALEATGKADNTYVIFTSDHGLAVGQHGLFGKQNMYDHSVRVPFVIAGPGIPEGHRIEAPIYLQDIIPTTLELAGASIPDHVEFTSFAPLLRGEAEGTRRAIYGCYREHQRMVTHNGRKLMLYPKAGVARLYNLEEDPLEMNDLADHPESKPLMRELFAVLQELQKKFNDPLDLTITFPNL